MPTAFVAGQNAALPSSTLVFGASAAGSLELAAVITDTDLRAASAEDLVCYDKRTAPGLRLDSDRILIDLDAVRADADAVLCVASADPAAGALAGLSSRLATADGAVVAEFEVTPEAGETAVICWELYRRNGICKVRAIGSGYAGGLAELLPTHGIETDAVPADAQQADPSLVPVEEGRALERAWMIFEDAARSATSLESTRAYALMRLDQELSALVADPTMRTSRAGVVARESAQRRHDELVATAQRNHDRDAALLTTELATIDTQLPRPMATWWSPSWTDARRWPHPPTPADGIRIGELSAPDRGSLTVPFCVQLPLGRPIWVDSESGVTALPVLSALTLRILSATPMPLLDVVDLSGSLRLLTDPLSPVLACQVVRSPDAISATLAQLTDAVDLAELAELGGLGSPVSTHRLLILGDFPHGCTAEDLSRVTFLAARGAAIGLSILLVGGAAEVTDEEALLLLDEHCQLVPAVGDAVVHDPWIGTEWTLAPDTVPADPTHLATLFAAVTDG